MGSSSAQCSVPFLLELIRLYEQGKPTEFFNFFDGNQKVLKSDQLLNSNYDLMVRKIRVVSLCDSIFFSEKNSNRISFEEISKIVGVPIEEVELLVIHVLSIKLISGHIDEARGQLVIEAVKKKKISLDRKMGYELTIQCWKYILVVNFG